MNVKLILSFWTDDEILAALPVAVEMHLPWKTRDEDDNPLRQMDRMTRLDFEGLLQRKKLDRALII